MLTSRPRRAPIVVACFFSVAAASCANGGVVTESSSSTSAVGSGGGDGRGGGGGRGGDDDTGSGKTSGKSSGTQSGGGDDGGGSGDAGGNGAGGDGASGDGGAASSGATTTSGTGAPCSLDDDCFDGDPCTLETCGGVEGCTQTFVPAGQTGTAEGTGCDGVCQTDGACGLSLYERTFAAGQPFSRRALSEAWTGANAPPPRGIAAVEQIYGRDTLFVFTDDGQTYIRSAGAWQAPVATSTAFAGLDATQIDCVMAWQPQPASSAYIYFYTSGATHQTWEYSIDAANVATLFLGPIEQTASGLPNEPPYGQFDCDVSFMYQYAYSDQSPWFDQWEGYNGSLWSFEGAVGTWVAQGAQEASPVWASLPGGPAPGTTRDIYMDGTTLLFVAP